MKSNEEFIAGIYEKAASYTEEKETKIIRVNFASRVTKIAAMVAVCLGLAGVGTMMLGGQNGNTTGENGIALSSENDNQGIALIHSDEEVPFGTQRMIPELSYLEGVIESIHEEAQVAFVRLHVAGEEVLPAEQRVLIAVRFATEESLKFGAEIYSGMQIKVGGTTAENGYKTETAEYLLLTVTTKEHIWIWSQESGAYENLTEKAE